MENSYRKCAPKLVPDPFLILVNNPEQPLHARNSFKKRYFELYFFFRTQSLFDGKSYQKQKGPGTSDQSLFRVQSKFRKIPLLVIYYLTKFDDIV